VPAEITSPTERTCLLAARAGRVELCSEDCPLWEHGQCQLEAVLDESADDRAPEPDEA
jgi:hypothetical protein